MQSFKQYLKEDNQHVIKFITDFNFVGEDYLQQSDRVKICALISKSLKIPAVAFVNDSDTVELSIGLTLNSHAHTGPQLEELQDVVSETLSNYINQLDMEINYWYSYIHAEGIPKFPIDYKAIVVDIKPGDTITGIEKIITLADELTFRYCKNIKGGVLSFLKINAEELSLFDVKTPINQPEWIGIITKYFGGDRRHQ